MAIKTLTTSYWDHKARVYEDIINPSWEQVEAAIRALNNRERNDIYLMPSESNPETYLSISGGNGRYFVTGSIDNQRFPTVIDLKKSSQGKERLVSGGQEILISSQWIVDLETALNVIKSFYEAGGFNCGIEWQFV